MFKITYTVSKEEIDKEKEWLKLQKVYPATRDRWELDSTASRIEIYYEIGAIVDESMLLSLKLRKNIKTCVPYRK